MKKLITFCIISLVTFNCLAQDQHLIDSLEAQLKSIQATKLELGKLTPKANDTTEANILADLSKAYWENNPDKAIEYANQCLALSQQIGYKKGIGRAYASLGFIEKNKGNFLPALELLRKALEIRKEIGDKLAISNAYNTIGQVYFSQGNYPEALKNYFIALKIAEEIGGKQNIASCFNNIGGIYQEQNNYPEALKYFFNALKINEELGNKQWQAYNLGNIGLVYDRQGKYPEAMKNFLAVLKIAEEIGDKLSIAYCYNNLGDNYQKQSNLPEALKNFLASLKINEEIHSKYGISLSYINIGDCYLKQKKYNEAAEYLNRALSLSKEIGSLELIKHGHDFFAKLDSAQGNYSKALEHYKLYITYRDSLVNTENSKKTLALQMNYEFDKKQDSLQALQAKKDLIATNEKNKQRLLRNGFIGGFGVMLLFAGIFFKQRNKIKKGKQKSDELLLNILPSEVAEELKDTGNSKAKNFNEATVMFTDFKDFTNISEQMSPEKLVKEIDTCFSAFDHIIHKYGVEKIKTIGDAYMCAGGLPVANTSHAENVVKAALEIRDFMSDHNKKKILNGELPFEIRIGINTGPVVAGIVGVRKFAYDIWGDTVNLANRIESSGEPGKVNISESTYKLVKDKFTCVHRGKIQAKNKGEVEMYFVEGVV